jgi:hypothetical protein
MERFFENNRWLCLAGNETNSFTSLLWADDDRIVFPYSSHTMKALRSPWWRWHRKRNIIRSGTWQLTPSWSHTYNSNLMIYPIQSRRMRGQKGRSAWCKKNCSGSQTRRKDRIGKKKPCDSPPLSMQCRGNNVDMASTLETYRKSLAMPVNQQSRLDKKTCDDGTLKCRRVRVTIMTGCSSDDWIYLHFG